MQGLMTQQIIKKKKFPKKKKNTVKKTVALTSKKKPTKKGKDKGKAGRPKNCPKCKRPKTQCICGRPLFDGKDEDTVIAKLESAFSIGCTDKEACMQADISPSALYNYQKNNPDFQERKDMLKEKLVLAARNTVSNVIQEKEIIKLQDKGVVKSSNVPTERALKTSQWYLERKKKSEFAPQVNGIVDDGKGEGILTKEREAEIAGALGNWTEDDDDNN